ncbi:guanine nucleotide-binding protein G(i) subunit alpha-3-like [Discoglossus pictus]
MSCIQDSKYKVAEERSKMIDQILLQEKRKLNQEVKVLLLGARESGKSTIIKQMKIIYGGGFSEDERKQYRAAVYRDIIQSITDIIMDMERRGIDFGDKARADDAQQLLVLSSSEEGGVMSEELAGVIQRLWEDVGVQDCLTHSRLHGLSDTTLYYLNNLDRISQDNYVPTQEDVLRVRVKTTGITETNVSYRSLNFRLIDVGEQRSSWKKWIHFFETVHAIIFCVALNNYDRLLEEKENPMHKNMTFLQSLIKSKWLTYVPIFLIFNKKDLFKEKINRFPLTTCFPEYTGSNTYPEAVQYVDQRFQDLISRMDDKPLNWFLSCALDTENMMNVFDAVVFIIIRSAVRRDYWSTQKQCNIPQNKMHQLGHHY